MQTTLESWGLRRSTPSTASILNWRQDWRPNTSSSTYFVHGLGRSYGDICLGSGQALLTKNLNRLISFNSQSGILHCESGVSLQGILEFAVPRGFFLSVSPGTKHVSLGGAIANDVHGKNHHQHGSFGRHILSIELLRSDGFLRSLNVKNNDPLFSATIGGMGLTGLILSARIQLKKISSPWIECEHIQFNNLEKFFSLSEQSDSSHEYTVSWVNLANKGKLFGSGIFMRGNHQANHPDDLRSWSSDEPRVYIPRCIPSGLLNDSTQKILAWLYLRSHFKKHQRFTSTFDSFFYPLDVIHHWNRAYGTKGFYQYQCVLPKTHAREALAMVFEAVRKSPLSPFLTVLKMFGSTQNAGLMSFPMEGPTLCLDLPDQGSRTLALFDTLDDIVNRYLGRVYLAKDARLSKDSFVKMYPNFENWKKHLDPCFASSLSQRLWA